MPGRAANLGNVVSLLGAFVATALVMGLLAAGLLIPAVGATGSVATAGVKAFDDLPSEFSTSPLSQQSRILDARGRVLATPQEENRTIVRLDQVAPIMRKAQIAIEDSRFYEHGAIDAQGTLRALVSDLGNGEVTQGGSGITQQYVKNLLLTQADSAAERDAAKEISAARKIRELRYAVALEKRYPKDEILRRYLNIAYYGAGAYGIEAASRRYFSKHASQLNLAESAMTRSSATADPTVVAGTTTRPNSRYPAPAQADRPSPVSLATSSPRIAIASASAEPNAVSATAACVSEMYRRTQSEVVTRTTISTTSATGTASRRIRTVAG